MTLPPVSIIIPTLNEELYIANLLASLSSQTDKNFEVIVVDGKSKDKTVKIAKNFDKILPSLKIIKASHNGVSYQRNLGAQASQYSLLLFLDADVIVPPNFLELALAEFCKKKADVATASSLPFNGGHLDYFTSILHNNYQRITKDILPLTYGWTIFAKKSIHNKIGGFDEKMFFAEDSDYSQRISQAGGKFEVLASPMPYVSARRIQYEGRSNLYRKILIYTFYRVLYDPYIAQTKIKYVSGDFAKLAREVKKETFTQKFRKLNRNLKKNLRQLQAEIARL